MERGREVLSYLNNRANRCLENILGTLRGMEGISFIYLIPGDAAGVKFYFGAARDKSYPNHKMPFSVHDLEQDFLRQS